MEGFSPGTVIDAPYAYLPSPNSPGGFRVAEWITVEVVRREGDEYVCQEPHYGEIRYPVNDPGRPLHRSSEQVAERFRNQPPVARGATVTAPRFVLDLRDKVAVFRWGSTP